MWHGKLKSKLSKFYKDSFKKLKKSMKKNKVVFRNNFWITSVLLFLKYLCKYLKLKKNNLFLKK